MSAADDLIIWTHRWKLDAHTIQCRCCHGRQPEQLKVEDFPHLPGCGYESTASTPWASLDTICSRLQKS
ncbi:hypothetical protein [Pseudomonas graminis]|uniref:Uncharacterized protein n=1 Tax=Pseudomonas graminis TaxID=158627 RepID=A0A1C2DRH2_9PSED|nr:hypothetical protein [Pseudomonas graminis]OCX17382.1 hypothetical protein BBI10_17905 [Pseudomonas graminis]